MDPAAPVRTGGSPGRGAMVEVRLRRTMIVILGALLLLPMPQVSATAEPAPGEPVPTVATP